MSSHWRQVIVECCVGSGEHYVKSHKGEGIAERYERRYWRFERRPFVGVKRFSPTGISIHLRKFRQCPHPFGLGALWPMDMVLVFTYANLTKYIISSICQQSCCNQGEQNLYPSLSCWAEKNKIMIHFICNITLETSYFQKFQIYSRIHKAIKFVMSLKIKEVYHVFHAIFLAKLIPASSTKTYSVQLIF